MPGPKHVAEFTALCREKFGVTFESEEEATKAMTDMLQLYYALGGHLRRFHTIEELVSRRAPSEAGQRTET